MYYTWYVFKKIGSLFEQEYIAFNVVSTVGEESILGNFGLEFRISNGLVAIRSPLPLLAAFLKIFESIQSVFI